MQKNSAFTLLEGLIVLVLIIILCSVAFKNYQKFIIKHRAITYLQNLAEVITNAKVCAYYHQSAVTICVIKHDVCVDTKNWHDGITVFYDPQHQHKLDNNNLIKKLPALPNNSDLIWSGGIADFLTIQSSGRMLYQNGNIQYKNNQLIRPPKLVINAGGRIYIEG